MPVSTVRNFLKSRRCISVTYVLSALVTWGQNPLEDRDLLSQPEIREVFDALERYQPQIVFSRISRDDAGSVIGIETHTFNVDPTRYFYPASTVKLPAAIIALERLESDPKLNGVEATTRYRMFGEDLEIAYPNPEQRESSLLRDIERVAVASDNMAFNRLFDFVGPDVIEARLLQGERPPQLSHRLAISLPSKLQRSLMGFEFEAGVGSLEPRQLGPDTFAPEEALGIGYRSRGELIPSPFAVHRRNFISLEALHDALLGLVIEDGEAFGLSSYKLSSEHRSLLIELFSRLPRNSPEYASENLPDNYVKYLIYGDQPEAVIPDSLTIINKIGQAYGFLSDVAYVSDAESGVAFALSAVVYVNANEIFNDNVYEYDTIGLPFLGALGRAVLRFEQGLASGK